MKGMKGMKKQVLNAEIAEIAEKTLFPKWLGIAGNLASMG